jgi:hypothetical protein
MFVFDLFEKKKQDAAAGRFVGGTSQDARVKNALDNAYRAVPAAKSPEEAALGYIDIQNSLNQKQDQVLDQQNKTNQQQTKQINDLVNDMRRKENDFRNLNAQIASMPNVTPQQAAKMAQDIEAAHSSDKGEPVDVPSVVAKQTAAQPAKKVAAPGPGASIAQLANYQQAKDQGAATAKAPTATPQATPAPAVTPPGRVVKGKNQPNVIGQMAQQLTTQPTPQPAQPTDNVLDFTQALASQADKKKAKVAGLQIDQPEPEKDQPDQKVAENQAPAGSDPTSIAKYNIEQLSKAYMSDARSVKMQFTTGQDLALQNTQIHALVDVISNLPDGANKQALLVNLFSNRTFLIEWMFENILNKPAQATQQPDAGQLEMYEGDVVPMTQDQSVLQAYNDVLKILKASKTKQPDVVAMMRQDWASRYKQRFQISTAPDGTYYMLDKTTNQHHRLPDPRTFPMEEDAWHNGQNAWSSEHDQWAKESVEETRLTVGDPVIVTAPNEFEGKTGEIAEFSPSGKFVIVNLYNYGEHSMHLSDVEYNKYADEEDELEEFNASGYDRYSIYMDDYDLKEKFSDLDDAIEAIEAYKRDDPKSRYEDYNVRDLDGKVVWRNDAWQDVQKPGKIQFLPRNDQGMAESAKPGEYYIHTVYFKDGTKKRIRVTSDEFDVADYYNKRGQAVDRVDYDFQLHSDMSEAIGKKDLLNKVTKDLNSDKFKNTPVDPNRKGWTGAGKDDYGYTGYQGHGMPTDRQERELARKKKGVSEAEGEYKVYYMTAEDHKLMGRYASREEAEQRLNQLQSKYPDNKFIIWTNSKQGMTEMDKSQPSQERHGNRPLGAKGATAKPVTAKKLVKDLAMDLDQAFAKEKQVKKKGVKEGHADQQRRVFKKNGEPVGEVGVDRESSPGVGQYYMKHYSSGKDLAGYDSYEEAVAELKHCMKQGVAEGQVSDNVSHRGDVDTTANIEVLGVDLNNDTFKITYNGKPYTIKIQYFSKEDLGRWQIPDYEIDVINAKGKNIIDLIDWDNWENDRRFNMVNTTIAYLDTQHAGDIQLMAWRQVGIENSTAEALYQEIQDFYKNNKQQIDKATAWLAQNIEDAEERQVFADFAKNPVSTPAKTKYIPKEYLMYVAFSYSREGNTEMTPGMNLPKIQLADPDDEEELYRKVDELFRKVQFKFDAFENKIVELADSYGLGSDPDLESGFGQRSMFWDHKTMTTSSSESNKNRQQILAQGILKFQADVEKYVASFNNTLIKIGLPGIGEYSTWSGVLGDQLTDQQVRYFATPEGFTNLASGKIDVAKMIDDNVAKQGVAEGETSQQYKVAVDCGEDGTFTVKVHAGDKGEALRKAQKIVRNEHDTYPEGARIVGQGVDEDQATARMGLMSAVGSNDNNPADQRRAMAQQAVEQLASKR